MSETNNHNNEGNLQKLSDEELGKLTKPTNDITVDSIESKPTQEKRKFDKSNDTEQSEKVRHILDENLNDLIERRNLLKKEIEALSLKKVSIEKELTSNFVGQSDAIARRLKGFQEYLTGAFQELAQSAEQLELVSEPVLLTPSPLDKQSIEREEIVFSPAISDTFKPDEDFIRDCLTQYLEQPEFYADPWKFRRSLEIKDKELLLDWFFSMGGRGAQPSRGNRSKNILLAAALIAILGDLYGERFQTLVLASQPERLGEWRRGLQDALGLSREDFGPNSGIMLFERSDGLIERADRLEDREEVPLILIDAAEQSIDTPILQFPIWLAFVASPEEIYADEEEFI